jgi:hypothetical protein
LKHDRSVAPLGGSFDRLEMFRVLVGIGDQTGALTVVPSVTVDPGIPGAARMNVGAKPWTYNAGCDDD